MSKTKEPHLKTMNLRKWYSQNHLGAVQRDDHGKPINPSSTRRQVPTYKEIKRVLEHQQKENLTKARSNQRKIELLNKHREEARNRHKPPDEKEKSKNSEKKINTEQKTSTPNFRKLDLSKWKKDICKMENGEKTNCNIVAASSEHQERLFEKAKENYDRINQRQKETSRQKKTMLREPKTKIMMPEQVVIHVNSKTSALTHTTPPTTKTNEKQFQSRRKSWKITAYAKS